MRRAIPLRRRFTCAEEDVASAVAAWPPPSASAGAPGGQSADVLRAAERLRAAALPLYGQLFGPLSREPGGGARCGRLAWTARVLRAPCDRQYRQQTGDALHPGTLHSRAHRTPPPP